MFQRFASALFGGDAEELIGSRAEGGAEEQEEQEEDWILVDCLAEACSAQQGHAPSSPATPLLEDEDGEEDLVMVPWPSRSPSPLLRYASSTSLHSTEEEEEEEEDQEEEGGFLRLDAPPMAESWLVTPPPCFTGGDSGQQVAPSCSPLENLLIEHPSMSVYARHGLLRRGRSLLPEQGAPCPKTTTTATAKGKRRGRRRRRCHRHLTHRPEAVVQQRRPALHSAHCSVALSAVQVAQPLSRNALRRLNLLRPLQVNARNLQQPSQRRLNF